MEGFYERRIFPWVLGIADRAFRQQRGEVLARATGRVLEIGIGTGTSLPFYTPAVTELVGIEPSEALRRKCQAYAREGSHSVKSLSVQEGDAQALRFADHEFDSVVAFLVFCTIPDPVAAAKEVFRVLKPGGKLFFFEHVIAETEQMPGDSVVQHRLANWQRRWNPLWNKVGCGCHLIRDTRKVFSDQGFQFEDYSAYRHPKIIGLVSPVIQGTAIKPL